MAVTERTKAVLSAVVHAHRGGCAADRHGAFIACRTLDSEQVSRYVDMVEARLAPVARRAMEELMETRGNRLQTAHARKHSAAGEKKGFSEGFDEGYNSGLERAFQQKFGSAVEQARREVLASLVMMQLVYRFGPLPAHAERAIAAANSPALFFLGQRMLAAASLDDLLPRPARRRTRATAAGTRSRRRAGATAAGRNRARSRAR